MKKMMLVIMSGLILICLACTMNAKTDVEKAFKADFPDIAADTIRESPVKGIYEVTAGSRIYYFAPRNGIIFTGQMFDKTKRNLTAERMQDVLAKFSEEVAQKAKKLPLDKAIKTGSGKHVVIEFTDPDCPFCRNAARFFASRTDVTKYTYLFPLPMHKDAPEKERYILCQKDRSKALGEVMKGNMDGKKYETCANAEVDGLIKVYQAESKRMGISSTPLFIIDGKVVGGADISKIESILKGDTK